MNIHVETLKKQVIKVKLWFKSKILLLVSFGSNAYCVY